MSLSSPHFHLREDNVTEEQARLRAHYESRKEMLNELKMASGCVVCGYNEHPAALQFHHKDPSQKRMTVAKLAGASLKRLHEEIDKCEIVCANCHSIKHYQ